MGSPAAPVDGDKDRHDDLAIHAISDTPVSRYQVPERERERKREGETGGERRRRERKRGRGGSHERASASVRYDISSIHKVGSHAETLMPRSGGAVPAPLAPVTVDKTRTVAVSLYLRFSLAVSLPLCLSVTLFLSPLSSRRGAAGGGRLERTGLHPKSFILKARLKPDAKKPGQSRRHTRNPAQTTSTPLHLARCILLLPSKTTPLCNAAHSAPPHIAPTHLDSPLPSNLSPHPSPRPQLYLSVCACVCAHLSRRVRAAISLPLVPKQAFMLARVHVTECRCAYCCLCLSASVVLIPAPPTDPESHLRKALSATRRAKG